MATSKINKEFLTQIVTIPNISFTANTEVNGEFNVSSLIPSGYHPIGVIGFNISISNSTIRRVMIGSANPYIVFYSVTSPVTTTIGMLVTLLLQKT
jgi:hypothetical protein